MSTVNFWPILVAAIVAFGIGALWYSPILFGREWMMLTKMTSADIAAAKAKGMWKSYVTQFIVSLVMFCVLTFLIVSTGTASGSDGAFLAFIVWLGFVATEAVGRLLWENKPFKLIMISGIGSLITLVIGGAIIGAWR
ncbi:MAG: hypothetical protein QOG91_230 [Candidatus Parcubacteria bacterium]|jgi:hypothetical protein|nr:hypothetical protein [Candidatus Parcubacteria bacterium]